MTGEGISTVLFVADSSDALAAAEQLDDYRVETVRTAAAAMDVADASLDALVVAAYLPDRSGASLLETVRNRGIDARAAVLAGPEDGEFPGFDIRVETPPATEDLERALDRLAALRVYDDRVERLYELAKRQSTRDAAAPPVGDGGFDAMDGSILDARAAADSALCNVETEDLGRLFVDGTGEMEDDSR
jgi:CheY-like chemotaxis protein